MGNSGRPSGSLRPHNSKCQPIQLQNNLHRKCYSAGPPATLRFCSRSSRAGFSFQRGRSVSFGPSAGTPDGFAHHPAMHSQLLRHSRDGSYAELVLSTICSNNSPLALHSHELLSFGLRPIQSTRSFSRVDQNKMPNWAVSEYRNHHVRCTQFGPFWKRTASDRRHHLSGADYWIDITRADRPGCASAGNLAVRP